MNKHSSIKSSGSLVERAAEMYDFGAALRGNNAPVIPVEEAVAPVAGPTAPAPVTYAPAMQPRVHSSATTRVAEINRERLAANNFIVPDGAVTGLSEEFRIVKRQLLLAARGGKGFDAVPIVGVG